MKEFLFKIWNDFNYFEEIVIILILLLIVWYACSDD